MGEGQGPETWRYLPSRRTTLRSHTSFPCACCCRGRTSAPARGTLASVTVLCHSSMARIALVVVVGHSPGPLRP